MHEYDAAGSVFTALVAVDDRRNLQSVGSIGGFLLLAREMVTCNLPDDVLKAFFYVTF